VPPLEEPTVAEMIRALGSKLDVLSTAVLRTEQSVGQYVTQEQRTHDKELAAVKARQQDERLDALEERDRFRNRIILSSCVLPVIVGVLVWLLTKGA
jgi:hypothetical protein